MKRILSRFGLLVVCAWAVTFQAQQLKELDSDVNYDESKIVPYDLPALLISAEGKEIRPLALGLQHLVRKSGDKGRRFVERRHHLEAGDAGPAGLLAVDSATSGFPACPTDRSADGPRWNAPWGSDSDRQLILPIGQPL